MSVPAAVERHCGERSTLPHLKSSSHFKIHAGRKPNKLEFHRCDLVPGRNFSEWQAGCKTGKEKNPKTEMNLLEYFPHFFGIEKLRLETPNFRNLLILAVDCANFQGVVAGIIKLIKAVSTL